MLGAAALIAAGGCQGGAESMLLNRESPDFSLKTLNGDSVSLAAHRGSVVLISFWAVG
jgi:hypothetical protein